MNPALGDVPSLPIEVRLDRHTVLAGHAWCAPSPRALVGIVHGLGEHSGRYATIASALVKAGFTCIALDLPGHGGTAGPRGHVPSWATLRERFVPALFMAARGLPEPCDDLPWVLFGHSMGGVIALEYALTEPRTLAALVLSAPALRTTPPPWWKLALARLAQGLAPRLGFPNGLDPEHLSRDPEVVRAYREDALVHDRITPVTYFAFAAAAQRCRRGVRALQVPTLMLQGTADRMVMPQGAEEAAEAAPRGAIRLVRLEGSAHESLHDLDRQQALDAITGWLAGAPGRRR
jgi:alpha-beta hydrolase superfamily lysophospholipase